MRAMDLMHALYVLAPYDAEITTLHNDHTGHAYLVATVARGSERLTYEARALLTRAGWHAEQDGDCWLVEPNLVAPQRIPDGTPHVRDADNLCQECSELVPPDPAEDQEAEPPQPPQTCPELGSPCSTKCPANMLGHCSSRPCPEDADLHPHRCPHYRTGGLCSQVAPQDPGVRCWHSQLAEENSP